MLKRMLKAIVPEQLEVHLRAVDHYFNGEPEIRLLKAVCPPTRLAVDVGANIGTYTYFLRRYMRGVVAYEPNPDLAHRLRRVFPDVLVRNVAVSDAVRQLVLSVPVHQGRDSHELGSVASDFSDEENVHRYE